MAGSSESVWAVWFLAQSYVYYRFVLFAEVLEDAVLKQATLLVDAGERCLERNDEQVERETPKDEEESAELHLLV